MEAAGHTVKAYLRGPRGIADGFVPKHGGPVVPEHTELLVLDGDYPGPRRMAQARNVPVIGGVLPNPAWLAGVQRFRQRDQALAYVATHSGPYAIDGQDVDGADAGRLLTWCSSTGRPLVVRRAGDGQWIGAFFGAGKFCPPWITWQQTGSTATAAVCADVPESLQGVAPKLARDGLAGFVGFLVVRGQPVEATTTIPPVVGALLDGDLASQFVRLARGGLGSVSVKPDPVTVEAVRMERPAGYPVGADWLGKQRLLDGVRMGRDGLELVDPAVGWRVVNDMTSKMATLAFSLSSVRGTAAARDADVSPDESSSEPAPWSAP